MDFLLGHDGVDWAAGACMIVMLWRLGRHKRDGFLWSAAAGLAWVVFNARLDPPSAPGVAINAAVALISLRSWYVWKRPGSEGAASADPAPTPPADRG